MDPESHAAPFGSSGPLNEGNAAVRANLRDVAKKAGVGLGTASRALSGEFAIRLDTALAVRKAAAELGYTLPTAERRPLPKGSGVILEKVLRRGAVAFLLPDRNPAGLTTLLSRSLLHGVESYCFDRKLRVIATSFNADGSLPECLAKKQVDGLIVRGDLDPTEIRPEVRKALKFFPWVSAMWSGVEHPADVVAPDFEAIGRLAASHLIRRGRKKLVCVNVLDERREIATCAFAFQHECSQHGLEATVIRRRVGSWAQAEMDVALDVAREVASLPFRPDGLFTPNDLLPLIPALEKIRWKQPRVFDFTVPVGGAEAAGLYRPNTAHFVNKHTELVGKVAAEQLIWRIQNPYANPRSIFIEPEMLNPKTDLRRTWDKGVGINS